MWISKEGEVRKQELLEAALERATARGVRFLEGYPVAEGHMNIDAYHGLPADVPRSRLRASAGCGPQDHGPPQARQRRSAR